MCAANTMHVFYKIKSYNAAFKSKLEKNIYYRGLFSLAEIFSVNSNQIIFT